jgi:hypothetical protein
MWHFILMALIVFITGTAYESLCILWDHFAGQDSPKGTALCAVLLAGCQIFGLSSAIKDIWDGLFFILGCGVGAYFSVLGTEEYLDDKNDEEGEDNDKNV